MGLTFPIAGRLKLNTYIGGKEALNPLPLVFKSLDYYKNGLFQQIMIQKSTTLLLYITATILYPIFYHVRQIGTQGCL